jgi:hypothetical protein
MKNFFEALKVLITHTPPLVVTWPYMLMFFGYRVYGSFLLWFGTHTFRVQQWLTPECCQLPPEFNIEKTFEDRR